MRIVENIKQEYFDYKLAAIVSMVMFPLALGLTSTGEAKAVIFGLAFFAGYVMLTIAAIKRKHALEQDLKTYIQTALDEKMEEIASPYRCKVVRATSHTLRYYIYINEYVTKEDIDDVMNTCYTETKIKMRYRFIRKKEDEFINNLFT